MHARYVTSVLGGVAGGFILVASQVFASGIAAWLAFAIAVGLLVLTAIPTLFGDRGLVGLGLDGVGAVLAIWTIVASLVFAGDTVKWLSFSEGAGFALLAVLGLTVNQVRLGRMVRLGVPATVATPAVVTAPASSEVRTAVAA